MSNFLLEPYRKNGRNGRGGLSKIKFRIRYPYAEIGKEMVSIQFLILVLSDDRHQPPILYRCRRQVSSKREIKKVTMAAGQNEVLRLRSYNECFQREEPF